MLDLRTGTRPTEKMTRTKCKRKRHNEQPFADATSIDRPVAKAKKARRGDGASETGKPVSHPLLSQLYPHVQTLRDYVLSRLPASSRLRRKKIASVGLVDEASGKTATEAEKDVARLLDTTVVAYSAQPDAQRDDRYEKWNGFSQKGDESFVTLSDGLAGACFSQTEVQECSSVLASVQNVLTPL